MFAFFSCFRWKVLKYFDNIVLLFLPQVNCGKAYRFYHCKLDQSVDGIIIVGVVISALYDASLVSFSQ